MAIYEAIVRGQYGGQEHLAKYMFSDLSLTTPPVQADIDEIVVRLNAVYALVDAGLHTTWITTDLEVTDIDKNIGTSTAFAFNGGEANTAAMPAWLTAGIRFNRPSPQFRHGYKRFSGLTEGLVSGDAVEGGLLNSLNEYAGGLLLPMEVGGRTIRYCQLKRVANNQPIPRANWGIAAFTSFVVYGLGTQKTRQGN